MAETVFAKLAVEVTAKATQLGRVLADQSKDLKGFQKTVTSVSNELKSALGILSIGILGKDIIDVTSNFQRFEAVLTNTLGSSSEAQKALRSIQDFAAKTPFSVQQLTSSFVKLANQGFKPTTEELRKLGDLSSSTGKEFDQLTEAIIDAQTGEFERLKEFGIRASKQGDQVKFTFKGVETQTKFTAASIREYILSLGDAEGVSGSMAAISQTLGGRISNLGDAWDNLLLTIGNGTKGPLNAAIESLTQLVNVAANLNSEVELRLASYGIKNLSDLSDEAGRFALETARLNGDKLVRDIIAPFTALSNKELFETPGKAMKEFMALLEQEGASTEEQIFLWKAFLKVRLEAAKADADAAKQARIDSVLAAKAQAEAYFNLVKSQGIIEKINLKLEDLEARKKKAFSVGEIVGFNEQIEDLRKELDLLNASRALSNFGKQQLKNAELGITTEINIEDGNGFQRTIDSELAGLEFKLPPVEPPDVSPILYAFDLVDKKFKDTGIIASDSLAKISSDLQKTGKASLDNNEQSAAAFEVQQQRLEQAKISAQQFGEIIGDAFGQAIRANESFSQSMKRVTAELLKTFLTRALGAAISTAFTSSGNPIIGAAVAGVAIGLVNSLFSRIGGPTKGGGGSISKQTTSSPAFKKDIAGEQIILVGGEFRLRGNDLALSLERTRTTKQRTG